MKTDEKKDKELGGQTVHMQGISNEGLLYLHLYGQYIKHVSWITHSHILQCENRKRLSKKTIE